MTLKFTHKISVCIPTYNYGRYLSDVVESVLSQTYTDFELVIVDNSSDDDTKSIVSTFLTRDKRVKYVCNQTNIGMVGNWNKCLELAKGEYIKLLCADDTLEPNCLEKQVGILEQYPAAVLTSCSRLLTDESLNVIDTLYYSSKLKYVNGHESINTCLKRGNLIGEPSATLFRSNKAKRGFLSKYRQMTDLEMWFHLMEQGDFICQSDQLCNIRQHCSQMTKINTNDLDFNEHMLLYLDYLDKPYITITNKLRMLYRLAGYANPSSCCKSKVNLQKYDTLCTVLYMISKVRKFIAL